ncbi:MAG: hypothetical protein WB810_10920 [Candidatus Cybelea sp.]
MRTILVIPITALTIGAVVLFTACSGAGLQTVSSALPAAGPTTNQSVVGHTGLWRSGIAPKFLRDMRLGGHVPPARLDIVKVPTELAVSDFETGAVEVLNNSYRLGSTITKGLNGPDGDGYDGENNLYVANYEGVNVTEYNEKEKKTFSYSMGLIDPVDVTTDTSGNVYVADFGNNEPSVVVEYPQGTNTPIASCSTGLANEGVAVDKKGNVFVSGQDFASGYGDVLKYAGGFSGCKATTVLSFLGYAGGLQIDRKGNLAVCDQRYGVVYVMPPPYKHIPWVIGGATDAFHIALDKSNQLIFIADPAGMDVLVDDYPTGKYVKTLNSSNGISDPLGVAASL